MPTENTLWCNNLNNRASEARGEHTKPASGHLPVVESRGQLLLSLIPVPPQAKVLTLLLLFGLYFYGHPRCCRCRPSHIIEKTVSTGERGLRTTTSYRAATHFIPLWWKPLVSHYTACVCLGCVLSQCPGGGRGLGRLESSWMATWRCPPSLLLPQARYASRTSLLQWWAGRFMAGEALILLERWIYPTG